MIDLDPSNDGDDAFSPNSVASGIDGRHLSIEQAKGALMALFGLTADDAFSLLVAQSQRRNIKLYRLADLLIGACGIGGVEQRKDAGAELTRFFDRVTHTKSDGLGAPGLGTPARGKHHLKHM